MFQEHLMHICTLYAGNTPEVHLKLAMMMSGSSITTVLNPIQCASYLSRVTFCVL